MKTSLAVKLGLAAVSAVISGLVVYAVLEARQPRAPLDTRWVGSLDVSAGAAPARASGFRARPLTELEQSQLTPATSPLHQSDPLCYYRYRANVRFEMNFPEYPGGKIRAATNDHGLRGTRDVRVDRPELRILVLGDSHTDGVCDPSEAYPALLGALFVQRGRDVEVLNAGVAGYSFHHYVGALERYLPLAPDLVVVGLYGGNDFQESLLLQHLFAGTPMPSDAPNYRERVTRAKDISEAAVGQGLLALRYFADHPGEIEVALQAAREACAEIVALSNEHGARVVFVYIPPAFDVAWKHHANVLDAVAGALELPEQSLTTVDAMADRCLEDLRAKTEHVIDLRTTFRELDRSPYWSLDFHIDLEGQRQVAAALEPLVERLFPPEFERTAHAPRPGELAPTELAPSIGAAWKLDVDDEPIEAPVFDAETAARWFDPLASQRFDANLGFVERADPVRGIGSDGAWPEDARRDGKRERVLILGDELSGAGAVSEQRLGALLERAGIACVDATTVGHGPGHYVARLANGAKSPPETVVVVWNAANDFSEAFDWLRALERNPRGKSKLVAPRRTPREVVDGWLVRPREARVAAESALRFAAELRRRAGELGARLVIVIARPNAGLSRAETREGLDALDRVATAFSSALSDAGFEVIDECERLHAGGPPAFDAADNSFTLAARAELAASIVRALGR